MQLKLQNIFRTANNQFFMTTCRTLILIARLSVQFFPRNVNKKSTQNSRFELRQVKLDFLTPTGHYLEAVLLWDNLTTRTRVSLNE